MSGMVKKLSSSELNIFQIFSTCEYYKIIGYKQIFLPLRKIDSHTIQQLILSTQRSWRSPSLLDFSTSGPVAHRTYFVPVTTFSRLFYSLLHNFKPQRLIFMLQPNRVEMGRYALNMVFEINNQLNMPSIWSFMF